MGAAALALSLVLIVRAADLTTVGATLAAALADSPGAIAALVAYGLAFSLRAATWSRVLPALGFGQALAALHLSLAGNHLLPLRLGEPLRVASVVRRARIPLAPAAASTVVMRAADVVAVVAIAAALGPRFTGDLLGAWGWAVVVAVGVWLGGIVWLRRLGRRSGVTVRSASGIVAVTAAGAWVLESMVMFQAGSWAGISISFLDAVLVTAVTIAAQIVAIAPGGLGTYEAAATAALVGLGAGPEVALAAALTAHAVKTAYSLAAGAVALFVPSPGMLGKLRLPAPRPRPTEGRGSDGPIVLFFPAYDEVATIAGMIGRTPSRVCGRDVVCLVVDDGSADETPILARRAGAEVLSLGVHSGLGAAVRAGIGIAVGMGAAAVAFCDADGEYAPEELEGLVGPILEGRADYVVGSRFKGRILRMLPHRRLGNILLTRALAFVARTPITDGQSGYRALSREAAAAVEIVHNYNYAQVLTLDLLDKGFRYAEVPISYTWRREGRSYVRPGRYLGNVIPAVYRELNAPLGPATTSGPEMNPDSLPVVRPPTLGAPRPFG